MGRAFTVLGMFSQQVVLELIVFARHWSKCWGYTDEPDRQSPISHDADILGSCSP